jgi:putative FmdB family regulatory protein
MPTYDYQCRACGAAFSVRERIEEHATRSGSGPGAGPSCPTCQSRDVERVIAASYPRTARKS